MRKFIYRSKKYNINTLYIVQAGFIAAIYVVLTYISASVGLAYGSLQFRLSEILTILPIFTSAAIPGLAIGCLISNLASPLGLADIIIGPIATILATLATRALRNITFKGIPFLAPLPPVIVTAVVVGLMLNWALGPSASFITFITIALNIGVSEFIVCYMGLPLAYLIKKSKFMSRFY